MTDYSASLSLDDAIKRCKMPVRMIAPGRRCGELRGYTVLVSDGDGREYYSGGTTPAEARAAYLSLVAELQHAGGER